MSLDGQKEAKCCVDAIGPAYSVKNVGQITIYIQWYIISFSMFRFENDCLNIYNIGMCFSKLELNNLKPAPGYISVHFFYFRMYFKQITIPLFYINCTCYRIVFENHYILNFSAARCVIAFWTYWLTDKNKIRYLNAFKECYLIIPQLGSFTAGYKVIERKH